MAKVCSCEGCNNPVFSKGLCQPHWKQQYGKPLNRKPIEQKQRKRINPISEKKKAEDAIYRLRRIAFLEKNPLCVMCKMLGIPGCTIKATQVHHTQGRGMYYLDESTWLATCDSGHKYEVANSEKAYDAGVTDTRIVPVDEIIMYKLKR